jgi:hypothetical protein
MVTPAASIAGLAERNGVLWSTQCVHDDDIRRGKRANDAVRPRSVSFQPEQLSAVAIGDELIRISNLITEPK